MTRDELMEVQLNYVKKLTIALNKPLKNLKPVDSTKVVLKNDPPSKDFYK